MRCLLHWSFTTLMILAFVSGNGSVALAQKKSVKPGINKSFENPDPEAFVKRFERETRDVFEHRQEILKACKLKPGTVMADVGAGTGLFTRMFAKQVGPKGKVYAVDIAKTFLKHIEKTCQKEGIKNVVSVLCSQKSVELPAQSVDVVFICDTYHHFEFPYRTMASIHKALRPGGQVILIDFHRIKGKTKAWLMSHVRAGEEVFTAEIESCGFQKVERKDFLGENYFLRFLKTKKRS
ncbi:MAG: class I SAM-dependent methyltransferase [Gemmataceae bacterium]